MCGDMTGSWSVGLQGNTHCKIQFILAFFRCILTIQVSIIVDS
jgi:hypothetical protein